jgi:hypothetical protein
VLLLVVLIKAQHTSITDTQNSANLPVEISYNVSKTGNSLTVEEALIQAITTGTDRHHFVERLKTLNTYTKLTTPLVGNLEATIYVCQACEDQADIKETFSATIIPVPPGLYEVKNPLSSKLDSWTFLEGMLL